MPTHARETASTTPGPPRSGGAARGSVGAASAAPPTTPAGRRPPGPASPPPGVCNRPRAPVVLPASGCARTLPRPAAAVPGRKCLTRRTVLGATRRAEARAPYNAPASRRRGGRAPPAPAHDTCRAVTNIPCNWRGWVAECRRGFSRAPNRARRAEPAGTCIATAGGMQWPTRAGVSPRLSIPPNMTSPGRRRAGPEMPHPANGAGGAAEAAPTPGEGSAGGHGLAVTPLTARGHRRASPKGPQNRAGRMNEAG